MIQIEDHLRFCDMPHETILIFTNSHLYYFRFYTMESINSFHKAAAVIHLWLEWYAAHLYL